MIEILEELDAASNLFRAALDRYLSACSALKTCSTQKHTTSRFPREFSHRIHSELQLVSSYETRIKESKAAVTLSRNNCVDTVPISSLPDEILSRTFHLILAAPTRLAGSLRPIETSSHVGSRWRRIASSLGTLWSHIDIKVGESGPPHLARAVAYAARASHTPLYVIISSEDLSCDTQAASLTPFLASIAPRIKSLELNLYQFTEPYPSLLDIPAPPFLEAAEDPQMPRSQSIEVPKQFLEGL